MANCGKDILLTREGTEQMQRFLKALDPSSIKLNDFGLKEWMQFAYIFAEHVNYFDTNNSEIPSGNWKEFFIKDIDIEEFLKDLNTGEHIHPHLALFLSFIKLLELTQKRFNNLPKRHLDFYYKKLLKIEKQPATLDKVHAIFELAKSISTNKIEKETGLDAGKDKNGKNLIYKTSDELIVNKATVAQLKSVYNNNNMLKAAAIANSLDGKGTVFPGGEARWWPFGYYEIPPENNQADTRELTPLENAKIGFALSGKILKLNEGERNIQLKINFKNSLPDTFDISSCYKYFGIQYSGEKKWLSNYSFKEKIIDKDGITVYTSNLSSDKKTLWLAFQIPQDEKAIVAYNQKIHGFSFSTTNPVCRFIIKMEDQGSYDLFQAFSKTEISQVNIKVKVNGIKTLSLQNDTGTINAQKPFFPFGTQPAKNSKFVVDYREMFEKSWDDFNVDIKWKDTPGDFGEHYKAYRNIFKNTINPTEFKDEITKTTGEDFYIKKIDDFTATAELKNPEKWETVKVSKVDDDTALDSVCLFVDEAGSFETDFKVSANQGAKKSNGPFRLSLNRNFGHELFPKIYALAIGSNDKTVMVPNSPYTPLVDSITLSYSATETFTELIHEHPFGQSKATQNSENTKWTILTGDYKGGNLFIGLENAQAGQTISLLVQVLEGSESPVTESFSENEKVEWSVLCSNQWKKLDFNYMISNEIDNFLKSGIVKFSIPKEASTENTLLPANYIWVKANMNKSYNAVCKTIGINAQAVLAQFADNSNELSHLKNGIKAKTISKLVKKVPGNKSVTQPYSSFGGLPQETDEAFYRRVSERLRHKNRAITIWDYEHLVLQAFPEIYKVKCLNHSKIEYLKDGTIKRYYLAPGNVLLVVVPDIVNKNVFDIYKPRVSKATLNAIEVCVNQLNTLHVNASVINPVYEEVTVSLMVKFYKGYDENYYKKVLNEDIIKFLSPWAFDKTAGINFGLSFHKSVLINYIEELGYVDYVSDVKLFHRTAETQKEKGEEVNIVVPTNPMAILVSSKNHKVSTVIKTCSV